MFHIPSLSDFEDESYDSDSQGEENHKVDVVGQVLLDACQNGKLDLVKRLITKENVNSIINKETPLIAACRGNRLSVAKFLIEAGADVLKHGKDVRGFYTPLLTACICAKPALVKFLLQKGADRGVNKSAYGNRPLHKACHNLEDRDGEIVKMLIEAGAKVDARGSYGKTPLIDAIGRRLPLAVKQIEILLEAGADPDAFDMEGNRPLSLSLMYPNIFRLLVEHGADVNIVGQENESLYERDFIDTECLEILLDYDAGVDISCQHIPRNSKHCQYDVLMCCYLHNKKNNYWSCMKTFEKHFIKMEVACLYFGKGTSLVMQPEYTFHSYKGKQLENFRIQCKAEMAKMSKEKIGNTGSTYLDVLYQRRRALLCVKSLPLETCKASFPIYGGLIRSRFVMGRMKLPLLDRCMEFFELTELPHLQPISVAKILSYLSVRDLKNVISAHTPQKKNEDDDIRSWLLSFTASESRQSSDGVTTSTGVGAAVPKVDDGGRPKPRPVDGGCSWWVCKPKKNQPKKL